jgi:hypothetical protein
VSAGAELAEPAGDVDSCLEQADKSASEPTHNNRILRFIRSPHYCNGTVTLGPSSDGLGLRVASSVPAALATACGYGGYRGHGCACPAILRVLLQERALDSRCHHGLGKVSAARDFE